MLARPPQSLSRPSVSRALSGRPASVRFEQAVTRHHAGDSCRNRHRFSPWSVLAIAYFVVVVLSSSNKSHFPSCLCLRPSNRCQYLLIRVRVCFKHYDHDQPLLEDDDVGIHFLTHTTANGNGRAHVSKHRRMYFYGGESDGYMLQNV